MTTGKESAKEKILNAALEVIRCKGYAGTSVEDLCQKAGVTKGAFFHHFKSKEDLAISAAQYWSQVTDQVFANSPYQKLKDPLERLLGYIDFRKALLKGDLPEFTCLVGTLVQEVFDSSPAIREACRKSIVHHAEEIAREIVAAKKLYAPKSKWTAEEISFHIQAVIQGAFILAKAQGDAKVAAESISHLRHYIESLFSKKPTKEK